MQKLSHHISKGLISFEGYRKRGRAGFVERKLGSFDNLKILDLEVKNALRPSIATYFAERYGYEMYQSFFKAFPLLALYPLVILFIIVFNSWETFYLHQMLSKHTIQSIFMFLFPMILFGILGMFINTKVINWIESRYVETSIVDGIIEILVYEEAHPGDWARAKHKQHLLFRIEGLAICIEQHLPPRLLSADSDTDAWLKETMKRVATALRDKKKWILTPQENTRDDFLYNIASTLTFFVKGNWDALDQKEPEKITNRGIWHMVVSFLLKAIKTLLNAAFPLILFFALQQTPYAFTGALYTGVVFFLILYEFVVFASALNPDFSARIADAKIL